MQEEIINKETGEVINSLVPVQWKTSTEAIVLNPYANIAKCAFDEKAQKELDLPINDQDVEIKPDGIIYLPGVKYRNVLHKAFGRGAWALLPKNTFIDQEAGMVFYHGALFVNGQFVAESIGEQKYHKNNPNMTYATALEGAKTDCLTRCCKDLGIAKELWDPIFIKAWKKKYGIQVWCIGVAKSNKDQKQPLWRKKTDDKLEYPWKEEGIKSASKETMQDTSKPESNKFAAELISLAVSVKDQLPETDKEVLRRLVLDDISESQYKKWKVRLTDLTESGNNVEKIMPDSEQAIKSDIKTDKPLPAQIIALQKLLENIGDEKTKAEWAEKIKNISTRADAGNLIVEINRLVTKNGHQKQTKKAKEDFIEKANYYRGWLKQHNKDEEFLTVLGGAGYGQVEEVSEPKHRKEILVALEGIIETVKEIETANRADEHFN